MVSQPSPASEHCVFDVRLRLSEDLMLEILMIRSFHAAAAEGRFFLSLIKFSKFVPFQNKQVGMHYAI